MDGRKNVKMRITDLKKLIQIFKKMGLEGVHLNQTIAGIGAFNLDALMQVPMADIGSTLSGQSMDTDNCQLQLDLILQAQALLRKNALYDKINIALHKSKIFQPNAHNLPISEEEEDRVTSIHRDAAVNNLRFLNIFYGYGPSTFAVAVNLLDRLLGKVKANSKYLSCIATSCFYIAAKSTQVNPVFIPGVAELVKLSQCGGAPADLARMERLILDKLQWQVDAVTPYSFLQLFYEVLLEQEDQRVFSALVSSLEVLSCHFDIAKFRMETIALALVSYQLQEMGVLNTVEKFSSVVEMQFYCQIADEEFLQCRALIMDYLEMYRNQSSKLPRLQLTWSVSRRTLNKMKPSTKVLSDLEPIMEDEDDDGFGISDAGLFDSENDESELERQIRSMRLKSTHQGPVPGKQHLSCPPALCFTNKPGCDELASGNFPAHPHSADSIRVN